MNYVMTVYQRDLTLELEIDRHHEEISDALGLCVDYEDDKPVLLWKVFVDYDEFEEFKANLTRLLEILK